MAGRIEEEFEGIRGIERTSPEFRAKLTRVAERVGASPRDLACVISFETGHTFSPSRANDADSGGVGLLQFLPSTCRELGISRTKMASLTAIEQLDYVEKFLVRKAQGRPLDSARDLYMSVLWPKAIGHGENTEILNRNPREYTQNRGLDRDRDGEITAGEATRKMLDNALHPWARSRDRTRGDDSGPESPRESGTSWKAELASIGIRFALEYLRNIRQGSDPDVGIHAEQTWRLFTELSELPQVRTRIRDLTTLDGPELVRAVQGIVEAHRGLDRGAPGVQDAGAEAPKPQPREPALTP
jgi:hypothetical protein